MNTRQNYTGRGNSATSPVPTVILDRKSALQQWASSGLETLLSPPLTPNQADTLTAVFSRLLAHYQQPLNESLSASFLLWEIEIMYQGHTNCCEVINGYLLEQGITQFSISPLSL